MTSNKTTNNKSSAKKQKHTTAAGAGVSSCNLFRLCRERERERERRGENKRGLYYALQCS